MLWKTRRARTALAGSAATLLYLGAAVWAPLVHAQFEVVNTASAIGSEHSESAPVVHDDALCQIVTAFQLPAQKAPEVTSPETVNACLRLGNQDPMLALGFAVSQARAPPR